MMEGMQRVRQRCHNWNAAKLSPDDGLRVLVSKCKAKWIIVIARQAEV